MAIERLRLPSEAYRSLDEMDEHYHDLKEPDLSYNVRIYNGTHRELTVVMGDDIKWTVPPNGNGTGKLVLASTYKFTTGISGKQTTDEELVLLSGYKERGKLAKHWCCEIPSTLIEVDTDIYVKELNMVISTKHRDETIYHPTTFSGLVETTTATDGTSFGNGVLEVNNGDIPDTTRKYVVGPTGPVAIACMCYPDMGNGIYYYEKTADGNVNYKLLQECDYDPNSPTCVYPIYTTEHEASIGMSAGAYRKWKADMELAKINEKTASDKLQHDLDMMHAKLKQVEEERERKKEEYERELNAWSVKMETERDIHREKFAAEREAFKEKADNERKAWEDKLDHAREQARAEREAQARKNYASEKSAGNKEVIETLKTVCIVVGGVVTLVKLFS